MYHGNHNWTEGNRDNNIVRERNIIASERNIAFQGNAIIYVFHMTLQGLCNIPIMAGLNGCFVQITPLLLFWYFCEAVIHKNCF